MEELLQKQRDEFVSWMAAETTFAYGVPDSRTIADWWVEAALTEARKKWLEEEIEKLNKEKRNYPLVDEVEWRRGYTEAIVDQISRLEAELKALSE